MRQQQTWKFVLGKLADRMFEARRRRIDASRGSRGAPGTPGSEPPKPGDAPPGLVFVIGAGCSRQYGLPSFTGLLRYAYQDLKPEAGDFDPNWGIESLRDRLDWDWRVAKPAELRRLLSVYLSCIGGEHCTGYLRLAEMARKGYLEALVNMNFDILFEEAFEALEKPGGYPEDEPWLDGLEISRTFERGARADGKNAGGSGVRNPFPLYKPHGSLRPYDGVPILDIARSELFEDQGETDAALKLFRHNDVVLLGYSGADSKIADALKPEEPPTDHIEGEAKSYNQLFVLNLDHPNPRLLPPIVNRRSTELTVTGYAATFENVMEQLSEELQARERAFSGTPPAVSLEEKSSRDFVLTSAHFSAAEAQALEECRKLATLLRSTMAVAESGHNSLEKHAETIFALCLELADDAGIGLTAPEKYLLFCAAYLHDLGYFWAHSGSKSDKKTGWSLLTSHGGHTAELLQKHLPEAMRTLPGRRQGLLPRTYRTPSDDEPYPGEAFARLLIEVCREHSLDPDDRRTGSKPQQQILVGGFPIPVRMGIVQALFDAAEELSEGHPFYPSPYPLDSFSTTWEDDHPEPATEQAIEDPILDLYLRRKQREIQFEYERGRVTAWIRCRGQNRARAGESPPGGTPTAAATLLAVLARDAVEDLGRVSGELPSHWRAYGPESRWAEEQEWAFGHDGCTVCTSRLLYILATARRLLPTAELRKPFRHHEGHTLDETVERLLRYLLGRGKDDPCWWGIEEQQRAAERDHHGNKTLCSADYGAWAVRALAHVLTVDQEIREKTGGPWLGGEDCGIGRTEVVQLLEARWRKLAESPADATPTAENARGISLLSDRAEEPHSYILGHIGITYLTLRHLSPELQDAISLEESSWGEPVAHLREAREIFRNRRPSQLSRFYAWPAEVFLSTFETTDSKRQQADQALVGLLHDCLTSRIWIRSGEGRGSWGYNIENTQRIVSSLTTFWRAAFENPDRFASLIAESFTGTEWVERGW